MANILVLASSFFTDQPSGPGRLASDLAVGLSHLGHHVTFVCQDIRHRSPEHEVVESGLTLLRYRIPRADIQFIPTHRLHDKCVKQLLVKHLRVPPDIIHGHAPLQYLAAREHLGDQGLWCYTAHSPLLEEMKVSWKEQGIGGRFKLLFGRKILRRIETRCLDYSDVVTAKSSFTKTLLSQSYSGKLLDKVLVIPGWADLKKFTILPESRHEARAKLGWIEGVPILFTLRRLVHRMGLDNLIAALAKTRALGLNFHFYIGGTGPSLGDLQHQVAHYGLGTQVTFTGRISDEDLPLTFAASNATVLPTSALECFGLPIVESLACNRPALVTPVGALPEIVREFEPRWIAATNSSDGITEIIAKYLRKEIPQELDDPMRAKVAYYSSDRGIQDYLNCFQLAHL